MVVTPDGSTVLVTGYSYGPGGFDFATAGYRSSDGKQLWVRRYNGPGNSYDFANAMAVSRDGKTVFVAGESYKSGSSYNYATTAYSVETGDELWAAHYNGNANSYDSAVAVSVSSDGSRVFVTGSSFGVGTSRDYATIAYAADSGDEIWTSRYNGPANDWDIARALSVSPDGSTVYITGESYAPTTSYDFATIALSAVSGAQLWAERYDGPTKSYDLATSLAVSPDGLTVYVTGYSRGIDSSSDFATLAYSAQTGVGIWSARFNGPKNGYDAPVSLALNSEGTRLYVAGASAGADGIYDYSTVAYETDEGQEVWNTQYDSITGQSDKATSLAVSPDGETIYVTGSSYTYRNLFSDFVTAAYSASNGSPKWIARYDGTGNGSDTATSVGVSPDGTKVFVTGSTYVRGNGDDFGTVAYQASSCAEGGNESGPISGPLHDAGEPEAGNLGGYVHGVSCDVLVPSGL